MIQATKKIHIFGTVEEAIETLRAYRKVIEKKPLSKDYIVEQSVSSSIFRAFHGVTPSEIYRSWARQDIDAMISQANQMNSQEEYDKRLYGWVDSLIKHWASQVQNPEHNLIYGPAAKMVNLLLKMLNESQYIANPKLQPLLHVPFDEYSLKPLMNIVNQLIKLDYRISIPKNPTMKFVNTPYLYKILQEAVFSLCKQANKNPILYDYWCWDEKH